jgi:hypothetical protein
MWKLAFRALALILGLGVVVVIVGSLLPKQHVAARAISVRRKPDEVFELISDFKASPSWRPDVQTVELLPSREEHIRYREKGRNGIITMEVVESRPPQRLIVQIADKNLPFGGIWIFDISPTESGCRLNITERGEVYNPIFRVVSRFFLGYHRTIDTYLGNVSRRFGENAIPEDGVVTTP